jgi:transposase-like protein
MKLEDIELVKKATYSVGFKEQALSKVFSRGDRTVQAVADELNISLHTLKNWMKEPVPETETPKPPKPPKAKRPQDWSPEERLAALHESYGLSGEALNAWCREHGLFAHHLAEWKAEFCTPANGRGEAAELRALKAEVQQLERELKRKDKALAEAAALWVLQKKVRALVGEEVE